MRVLVVHAHPSTESFGAALARSAVAGLERGGHEVRLLDLYREGIGAVLSAPEREAYHSTEPIVDPRVRAHADHVAWAQGLVFVYPTWWGGLPALLKGWLERVLVPGVAFEMHDGKVRAGLRHVRRLAGVSTYGSGRTFTALTGDGGRRTITRALRMLCARRCRTRWLALHGMDSATPADRNAFLARVERELQDL